MRTIADDLLEGSIDLHAHIFPQIREEEPGRVLDHEWAEVARDCGMRGFAMKSHLWPTMGHAKILNCIYPEITALGAIVLNASVGGLSPFAVESAVRLGTRIIWMPTYSAANDIKAGSYSRRIAEQYEQKPPIGDLAVVDDAGKIRPEVDTILEIARDADVILATGHISAEESVTLARRAKEAGLQKLIFTHPQAPFIGASEGQILEIANLGYFIEFTWISAFPMWQSYHPRDLAGMMQKVGPERCIMTTDAQLDINPPPPEMLRMFIGTMLRLGLAEEDVALMVRRNPAKLAGLEV